MTDVQTLGNSTPVESLKFADGSRLSVFEQVSKMGHEQIVFCHDAATGLKALIAIHNTVLGPALGGTRMWNYATEAEALTDALRLSRGMTFKSAAAGLNLGGGKAVLIGDPRIHKTEALLRMYGKFVKNLNGKYITAGDIGISIGDLENIATETKYVTGLPLGRGGSGDSANLTAYGTYVGIKAAVKFAFGTDSLANKKIAVQGVGKVGEKLVEYLTKENAIVYISDVYEPSLKKVAQTYGATIVESEAIYDLDIDVYSPSAMGATVNENTLPRLKCKIIAGCANNQLKDEKVHGEACLAKGIVYVPDFLINAGGVINIATEALGKYDNDWATRKADELYDRILEVLQVSETENKNAQEVAMEIAMNRIRAIAQTKVTY